jgi:hypothetical protein
VADYGNGMLPADAPRGSYFDTLDGKVYGPDETPTRVRVIHLVEDRRHAPSKTAEVQADEQAERREDATRGA